LRFLQLYIFKLGWVDGLPGLQICMLTAFYNTFVKQGRLWEMEHALPQPDCEKEWEENGWRHVHEPRTRAAA